jgi:trimeric autotransporter adhesin
LDIRALTRLVSASFLLGAGALAITAVPVSAAESFVVRSTQDGGDVNVGDDVCDSDPGPQVRCTLRAAIQEANGDGDRDRIAFRIGGANATGVKVIAAATDLPDIIQPLTIDGYTQPSSRSNNAKNGTNARLRILLQGPGGRGLALHAPAEIRGLAITGFSHGIEVHEHGAVIAGNFIGTNAAGTTAGSGIHGILVFDARARIGGGDRADRNLISGHANNGIALIGNAARSIRGNLIGTKANGRTGLGNFTGILVEDSRRVVIGGSRSSMGNVIAFNQGQGIWVESLSNSDTVSVLIRRNSIFANGDFGITLDAGGGSNDNNAPLDSPPPPDTDIGANDLQN